MTKTTISSRSFDAAEYLNNEASIAAFVSDAMESGDPVILQNALNTAARARGMGQIADEAGLGRESLYKALRPGAKPQFSTVVKVLHALGVKLVAKPVQTKRPLRRSVASDVKVNVISAKAARAPIKAKSSSAKTSSKLPASKRHKSAD